MKIIIEPIRKASMNTLYDFCPGTNKMKLIHLESPSSFVNNDRLYLLGRVKGDVSGLISKSNAKYCNRSITMAALLISFTS